MSITVRTEVAPPAIGGPADDAHYVQVRVETGLSGLRRGHLEHAGIGRDLQVEIEEAVDKDSSAADECGQAERSRPGAAPALDIAQPSAIEDEPWLPMCGGHQNGNIAPTCSGDT